MGKQTASGEDYKPGQTKELNANAADTEALTTFYETLYTQRPDSKMAADFLLKHGLLPWDEAEALNKKMGKATSSSKPSGGGAKKAKRNDEDDFVESKPKPKAKAAASKPKRPSIPADDSSDDEFVAAKGSKPAAKPAPKKGKPAAPAKRKQEDDSSDEEDVPLSSKKRK